MAADLVAGADELARVMPTDLRDRGDVVRYRAAGAARGTTAQAVAAAHGLAWEDRSTPGGHAVTVFRPPGTDARAVVLFLHGGGLVAGNRFDGVDVVARHAADLGLEVRTLEYPLAPEHSFDDMIRAVREALADCGAAGLPVVVAGQSGGGGLAAAAALDARGRGTEPAGQLLICPMLDRSASPSRVQYADAASWSAVSDETAWRMVLAGARTVPPGERADLAGLPPAFLDTGASELFRDSVVDHARRLCAAGVSAELHMWSGAFHGADCVVESAPVSRQAHRARADWLRRLLAGLL